MKYSLLFLTVMPSPYQRELFHALAEDPGISINVFYYIEKPADRSWEKVEYEGHELLLPGNTLTWLGDSAHWNPGIYGKLKNTGYDIVVISDYSSITAQLAMWYLTFTGRKWIYWGETPGIRKGLVRSWIRSLLMLPIKHGADAVCAIGSRAENHYREWLHEKKPVFNIPYFCDLRPFKTISRQQHERIKILFSGQFIVRKGIDLLLQAFADIADECPDVDLILAGGTKQNINPEFLPGKYKDRIIFAGFMQPADLPGVFAKVDIFVLPSRYDGWGVVINEALGAGLPVIASDQVGAALDLVRHGENGFIFPAGKTRQFAEDIKTLVNSKELREKFGLASRRMADSFDIDEGVKRWKNACEFILAGKR